MPLSVYMMQTVISYVWLSPLAGFYTLCPIEFLIITSLGQQFQRLSHREEMCFLSSFCIQNSPLSPAGILWSRIFTRAKWDAFHQKDQHHWVLVQKFCIVLLILLIFNGKIPTRFYKSMLLQTGKKTESMYNCFLLSVKCKFLFREQQNPPQMLHSQNHKYCPLTLSTIP